MHKTNELRLGTAVLPSLFARTGLLAAVLALAAMTAACPSDPPTTGDGDGDTTGDGDGDGDTTGDGDSDSGTAEPTDGGSAPDSGAVGGDGEENPIPEPAYQTSARAGVEWKRVKAVEQDLMAALALNRNEVCKELDRFSCADLVHTVALGGNEPFFKAMYRPLAEPSVTTSIAIDRMVLAACSNAAERDRDGPAQVFIALDLNATTIADGPSIDETITTLFKRFHARLPTSGEITEVKTLLVDDGGASVSALDFAKLSCFAVGTMAEFVFY